ncbi:hypothetical protein E6C67_08110 [Azospirillum sp. TSA2s]|uniref:hypothetical protein n=1 Tax=Azospirillum sp. TSA2s TaxID=709810 RepID=UPI0010A9E1CC|nr:hypothetical protein [Azospirillum sp. TSA2s]QCG93904.1 hypothetical protein E6C67_08110 [Azospirillum sp. TSA2s]
MTDKTTIPAGSITVGMVTAGAEEVANYYDDGNDLRHREVARFVFQAMQRAAPSAAQADALADEREFNGQLVAMLKMMFDAPTMADGYAILADFAAQVYPGQPVALQGTQDSLTETALAHARQFLDGMDRFPDAHPISLGLEDGSAPINLDGIDLDATSPLTLGDLRALSAARAAQPVGEVVEALRIAYDRLDTIAAEDGRVGVIADLVRAYDAALRSGEGR